MKRIDLASICMNLYVLLALLLTGAEIHCLAGGTYIRYICLADKRKMGIDLDFDFKLRTDVMLVVLHLFTEIYGSFMNTKHTENRENILFL